MKLLEIVNTEEGKYLLGTLGQKPQNKIVHITANSFIEHLGGKEYKATFFSRRPIEKLFQPIIDKVEIANEYKKFNQREAFLHYSGLETKAYKYPRIYLTTSTFNPAAGANSPVDGRLVQSDNTTWANARNSTGATPDVTETTITVVQGETVGGTFNIARCVFLFDTAALTSSATISAATYSLYSSATFNNSEAGNSLSLVACTPAANNTLATGDYNTANWGTTKFATDITIGTFTTSVAYSDFALNADGLAAISKTSITKFGIRASNDISNTAPTARSFAFGNYADVGSNIPKLVVTFTVPSGAPWELMMTGVGR